MTYTMPEVLVTDRAVFFDGWELPWHIAQGGVHFSPGGSDDINRLTIEFLVSTTTFRDDLKWELDHMAEWRYLRQMVALEHRTQIRAIEIVMKEYM